MPTLLISQVGVGGGGGGGGGGRTTENGVRIDIWYGQNFCCFLVATVCWRFFRKPYSTPRPLFREPYSTIYENEKNHDIFITPHLSSNVMYMQQHRSTPIYLTVTNFCPILLNSQNIFFSIGPGQFSGLSLSLWERGNSSSKQRQISVCC